MGSIGYLGTIGIKEIDTPITPDIPLREETPRYFYDGSMDNGEDIIPLMRISKETGLPEKIIDKSLSESFVSRMNVCQPIPITPDVPILETVNSLKMGEVHFDTSKDSFESSVRDSFSIPRESNDLSNGVIEDFQNELNNEKNSNSETIADLPIKDSLLMVDEQINTTPSTESDEIKKSSVEILNPIPRESNDAKECKISIKGNSMESKFKGFENVLFEQNEEFSSYDESSSKVENKFDTFKCFSNPLFELDEEIITLEKDVFQNEVISNQEKTNDTCETEGDLKFFDDLLNENPLPPDILNVENDFQDNKEEIDISCDMIPPGIDTDDDSEGDVPPFEEPLYDVFFPLPEVDILPIKVEPVEVMCNDSHTYGLIHRELKCKALADLGASINLMPFSVYTKLGLPALQSTRMTLELANCSLCVPKGIARDVLVPVGRFTFPADFVVVDFECNYQVPLILGRPFLRTARVLIDVHGEELFQDFFSNPLFEKQDDFPSRNDESILKEEVHTENLKSHLNPLFKDDEEIISNEVSRQISPKVDVKTIVSFFSQIGNCVRNWATSEVEKDNDEANHEVFKSENENDLGVHDNEEEEIAFLDGLLEDENFFEINDKKVEFLERKTKEDFETKVEPKSKQELQVFHPDIEILNHFETTSYVGSDYVFLEDFSLVDMIFPMNIQGKIFDPGISHFEKDAFKDKSSKELAPSKALLTLDVFDPLHPPLMNFHVTKAFFGFTFSLLKIFSKKFVEPGIKNATVYLSSLVWGGFHLLEFLHPHYYPP
ncbi:reverse transcriptase domain-containing protein [Tanacetum coccineum]|uniref:Reverse transcriptase domain-containing protein n=1 Tax=Tanacetum coccineum TaxID=301880 RepID=A0ABQ5DYG5_9ASTR